MLKSRRGAFTLIELMVVVAIIVVMIAIILPSLGRAKEMARRSACAANLRSLGIGYRTYANEYNDYVPLGAQGSGFVSDGSGNRDTRDGSFAMYTQNSSVCGWLGLGMPNAVNAFTGYGPYFCPTALIAMPDRKPFTTKNAMWPSKLRDYPPIYNSQFGKGTLNPASGMYDLYDPSTGAVNSSGVNCDSIATYMVRITVPVGETLGSTNSYWIVLQGSPGPYVANDPRRYDPNGKLPLGYAYDCPFGGVGGQGVAMPKSAGLRTSAVIASDFVCGRDYVDLVHKEGVNALRNDGSASWVQRGVFDKFLSWKPLDYINGNSGNYPWQSPDYLGNGSNESNAFANLKKVYDAMDKN